MTTVQLKINFNLRFPKAETSLILMILRWSGNRLVYSTGEHLSPKYWQFTESKRERFMYPKSTAQDFEGLNNKLIKLEALGRQLFRGFGDRFDRPPSIEEMRDMLRNKTLPRADFYGFFQDMVNDKAQAPTRIQYQQSMNIFKNRWPNLTFDAVSKKFFKDLIHYLENEKGYSRNNTLKHIKRLREVMKRAYAEGVTDKRDYMNFKYDSESIVAVALNEQELEALRTWDLKSSPHLDNARDLFLVGCWTGLRFSDYSRLTPDHIDSDFIKIDTHKTGTSVVVPILPELRKIIDKHGGEFPRKISNQKLNQYIKEICKEIPSFQEPFEIERKAGGRVTGKEKVPKWQLIGTHTGRRSFCTNLYDRGIPAGNIMAISGHKTESMFFVYINRQKEHSAQAVLNIFNSQNLKIAK